MLSIKSLIFIILMGLLSSCGSLVRGPAISVTSGLMHDASFELETERSWEHFKNSVPASLKFVEGFLYLDPKNESLLISATKGYAAYAFAIHETLYLKDYYLDNDDSIHFDRAIAHYSRALSYGLRFLAGRGITLDQLQKSIATEKGTYKLIEKEFGSSDDELEGLLYTAQSLGGLINLQKTNLILISKLPIVKDLFDYVCERKPSIGHGLCGIFYGSYHSSRPRALGGNPELGKKYFIEHIKKYPYNFLGRVAFIQYYAIPMQDEAIYGEQKKILKEMREEHLKDLKRLPFESANKIFKNKSIRFYQALGIKRFEIIEKLEEEIF